jgi:DNA-binding transcriptional LysR family regulator
MELRHLRYFVAVAEELHFRRAAERLHVAQPAVSEQVRKLEAELGVKLFERTQRRVALTDAGDAMLDEARRVLRQAEVAKQAAQNADEGARQQLRIGYLPDSLPVSVPRALQRLSSQAPTLQTRLEPGSVMHLIEGVRNHRLDAAIVSHPAPTNGLRTTPLGPQGAVAALPIGHPNAPDSAIDLGRTAPSKLLVLPRETNPAFHNAIVSMCHDAGISPTLIEAEEPQVEHVLLGVLAGVGMALLPESVAERFATPGIRFVSLEGARPSCESVVVTRRENDKLATHAFLRAVSNAAKQAAAPSVAPDHAVAA